MKNTVDMGSSIIDLYMADYDGHKDDCTDVVETKRPRRKNANKSSAYARQKKGYFKSKKRMAQLSDVAGYKPSGKKADVIQGMLRSHQLPMNECKCEMTFGSSRANKRREDAAIDQMQEFKRESLDV